jgi:hypothetical protein
MDHKQPKTVKVNQEMYARIIKQLIRGQHTAHDIARDSGCHLVTAQSLLRCFRRNKIIHVSCWIKDTMNRDSIPVYRWGENEDCPRTKLTSAQRQSMYKMRNSDGSVKKIKQRKQSNAAMKLLM